MRITQRANRTFLVIFVVVKSEVWVLEQGQRWKFIDITASSKQRLEHYSLFTPFQ
jgi:hypothetical protein